MERDCGEQGGLPAHMGKADKRRGRFGGMAGGVVLCRPMLSVKIHLWGTAITE